MRTISLPTVRGISLLYSTRKLSIEVKNKLRVFIVLSFSIYKIKLQGRPRGPMDKASDYESGDSRFKSLRGRFFLFSNASIDRRILNIVTTKQNEL